MFPPHSLIRKGNLRILHIHVVKITKIRPPLSRFAWLFYKQGVYKAKCTRGVWFIVGLAPRIASILKMSSIPSIQVMLSFISKEQRVVRFNIRATCQRNFQAHLSLPQRVLALLPITEFHAFLNTQEFEVLHLICPFANHHRMFLMSNCAATFSWKHNVIIHSWGVISYQVWKNGSWQQHPITPMVHWNKAIKMRLILSRESKIISKRIPPDFSAQVFDKYLLSCNFPISHEIKMGSYL